MIRHYSQIKPDTAPLPEGPWTYPTDTCNSSDSIKTTTGLMSTACGAPVTYLIRAAGMGDGFLAKVCERHFRWESAHITAAWSYQQGGWSAFPNQPADRDQRQPKTDHSDTEVTP